MRYGKLFRPFYNPSVCRHRDLPENEKTRENTRGMKILVESKKKIFISSLFSLDLLQNSSVLSCVTESLCLRRRGPHYTVQA